MNDIFQIDVEKYGGDNDVMFLEEKSKIVLASMEEYAAKINASGVAVFAYADNMHMDTWKSEMRIINSYKTVFADGTGYNYIALAYSKVAESIETGISSGNIIESLVTGEFGYKGSAIAKINNNVFITAFSGSDGETDFKIAKYGLSKVMESI